MKDMGRFFRRGKKAKSVKKEVTTEELRDFLKEELKAKEAKREELEEEALWSKEVEKAMHEVKYGKGYKMVPKNQEAEEPDFLNDLKDI